MLMRRGFEEDPRFDWIDYWKDKCSGDGLVAVIDKEGIIDDFDKMQKKNLGDLVTGATTMLGNIGRKAILDGDMKYAARIFDTLVEFSSYIENGMATNSFRKGEDLQKRKGSMNPNAFPESDRGKDACLEGDSLLNCDDALSRAYFGIGKMAQATVEAGLSKGKHVDASLIKRTIPPEELGNKPGKDDFEKDPYMATAGSLYRCMIESEDGSLKRDMCTEMIKDVIVSGIKVNDENAYDDGIEHLSGYFDEEYFKGKKKNWNDMKTWVNSTVWMADGLIDLVNMENAGIISPVNPGTKKLLDALKKQKKEGLMEFSVADWIAQQTLIVTSNEKKGSMFNHHDKIIKDITEDRLSMWNKWLELYIGNFKRCPPENMKCMGDSDSPANKALSQLSSSINVGCFGPIVSKMASKRELTSEENESIKTCAKAVAGIIEKAGDEKVLKEATETFFLFAQENGGLKYIPEVKEELDKAISNRFDLSFIQKMKGQRPTTPIKEGEKLIQAFKTDMFKRRYARPATREETRLLNDILGKKKPSTYVMQRNYFLDTTTVEGTGTKTELVIDDKSPLFISEVKGGGKFVPVSKEKVAEFESKREK